MLRVCIGNGVAEELIHMTYGHELRGALLEGMQGCWVDGVKGDKLGQL